MVYVNRQVSKVTVFLHYLHSLCLGLPLYVTTLYIIGVVSRMYATCFAHAIPLKLWLLKFPLFCTLWDRH